jgi:SAM-dependent methyltransferase
MKQFSGLRRFIEPLKSTPFHPQWFVYRDERKMSDDIGSHAEGRVLDIGAGRQEIRHYLKSSCQYISLDYYQTATEWYQTRPHIFGDGQALPIQGQCLDTILLLDVLEHIPRTDECIVDIRRVLKPGGRLIIHVPFLYPLHDVPYDFHRWTKFGLIELANRHDFQIEAVEGKGHPIETAALLTNLSLSKTFLNWMKGKNPLFIFVILLPFVIFMINCIAWVIQLLSQEDGFMPKGYFTVWHKPE